MHAKLHSGKTGVLDEAQSKDPAPVKVTGRQLNTPDAVMSSIRGVEQISGSSTS
jgi:hypothetical protein